MSAASPGDPRQTGGEAKRRSLPRGERWKQRRPSAHLLEVIKTSAPCVVIWLIVGLLSRSLIQVCSVTAVIALAEATTRPEAWPWSTPFRFYRLKELLYLSQLDAL